MLGKYIVLCFLLELHKEISKELKWSHGANNNEKKIKDNFSNLFEHHKYQYAY